MKNISVLLILVLVIGLVAGCSPATEPEDNTEPTEEESDVVSAASITEDPEAFKAAMAADGTWIAAALSDFTFEEPLVLEGTIDHEGTEERKIALYEQDEDRNITEEYTLTTPSLTIKSDNTRIKGGTVDGDLYVEAMNLQLQHVVITGDVYFANEEVKASFTADEDTTIEGEMIVEADSVDVVSAASITDDPAAFKAAMAADGTWIASALADFTFEEPLVLEGTIDHEGTEERKIALYEQDEDRNITEEYTLTTPSLTIKSDNTRIKGGTVDGDLYVEGMNLQLQHVVITGDVYFANEDVKASFSADEDTTIEGEMMVEGAEADVVSAASITDDPAAFKAAMAADGTWIAAALADFTFEEELVLEGDIDHEGTMERKIALYEQDSDRNITAEYTLTTPKLTIKSDNTRIKGGTIDGDLYVEANNLQLQHVVVTGDVYFASEDVKSTFSTDEDTTIEGEMIVE